jgi:uracil-DNA glycosylase
VTHAERQAALDAIALEVRACTRCGLAATRTQAVPGEGSPDTEVVLVGEGPGYHEDRTGRPFVGRAGELLGKLLGSIEWPRQDVFITNVVKCRPPENRDPEPSEIEACAPYLRRQLEVLDPALVVTLGRHSMARFLPGARISQVHGTTARVDPATGARDATVLAMFHPAAALRTADIERQSYEDVGGAPRALVESRARRAATSADAMATPRPTESPTVADAAALTPPVPTPAGAPGPRPDPRAADPSAAAEMTVF